MNKRDNLLWTICDDQSFSIQKNITFSQNGEDKLFEVLFCFLFKSTPHRYLDIGSNDPVFHNNTYLSYINGGSGVLVEPNPHFAKRTLIKRPRDVFYNAGIAFGDNKNAIYYDFGEHSELNTFSESVGENVERNWKHLGVKLKQKILLPLLDINKILNAQFKNGLDILSMDVEGFDFSILKLINFEIVRPKLICIESDRENIRLEYGDNNIINFLDKIGYLYVATTHVNNIFIDGTRVQNNDFLSLNVKRKNWFPSVTYDCPVLNVSGEHVREILKGGVSEREPWGCWSDQRNGESLQIVPTMDLPLNFRLELKLRGLVSQKVLFVAGTYKVEFDVENFVDTYIFDISVSEPVSELSLIPSSPCSPKDLGMGDDERKLGIAIYNINFYV